MTSKIVLQDNEIDAILATMAADIAHQAPAQGDLALVGIRSRGEIIAQRLARRLSDEHGLRTDLGTLDITLYRDDLNQMSYKQPVVKTTEIDFDVDGRVVILVDDVMATGRSTRAAMNALMDLGRPRAIRMATLIDRDQRELPIMANYVGQVVATSDKQRVYVKLRETDGRDEVIVSDE